MESAIKMFVNLSAENTFILLDKKKKQAKNKNHYKHMINRKQKRRELSKNDWQWYPKSAGMSSHFGVESGH